MHDKVQVVRDALGIGEEEVAASIVKYSEAVRSRYGETCDALCVDTLSEAVDVEEVLKLLCQQVVSFFGTADAGADRPAGGETASFVVYALLAALLEGWHVQIMCDSGAIPVIFRLLFAEKMPVVVLQCRGGSLLQALGHQAQASLVSVELRRQGTMWLATYGAEYLMPLAESVCSKPCMRLSEDEWLNGAWDGRSLRLGIDDAFHVHAVGSTRCYACRPFDPMSIYWVGGERKIREGREIEALASVITTAIASATLFARPFVVPVLCDDGLSHLVEAVTSVVGDMDSVHIHFRAVELTHVLLFQDISSCLRESLRSFQFVEKLVASLSSHVATWNVGIGTVTNLFRVLKLCEEKSVDVSLTVQPQSVEGIGRGLVDAITRLCYWRGVDSSPCSTVDALVRIWDLGAAPEPCVFDGSVGLSFQVAGMVLRRYLCTLVAGMMTVAPSGSRADKSETVIAVQTEDASGSDTSRSSKFARALGFMRRKDQVVGAPGAKMAVRRFSTNRALKQKWPMDALISACKASKDDDVCVDIASTLSALFLSDVAILKECVGKAFWSCIVQWMYDSRTQSARRHVLAILAVAFVGGYAEPHQWNFFEDFRGMLEKASVHSDVAFDVLRMMGDICAAGGRSVSSTCAKYGIIENLFESLDGVYAKSDVSKGDGSGDGESETHGGDEVPKSSAGVGPAVVLSALQTLVVDNARNSARLLKYDLRRFLAEQTVTCSYWKELLAFLCSASSAKVDVCKVVVPYLFERVSCEDGGYEVVSGVLDSLAAMMVKAHVLNVYVAGDAIGALCAYWGRMCVAAKKVPPSERGCIDELRCAVSLFDVLASMISSKSLCARMLKGLHWMALREMCEAFVASAPTYYKVVVCLSLVGMAVGRMKLAWCVGLSFLGRTAGSDMVEHVVKLRPAWASWEVDAIEAMSEEVDSSDLGIFVNSGSKVRCKVYAPLVLVCSLLVMFKDLRGALQTVVDGGVQDRAAVDSVILSTWLINLLALFLESERAGVARASVGAYVIPLIMDYSLLDSSVRPLRIAAGRLFHCCASMGMDRNDLERLCESLLQRDAAGRHVGAGRQRHTSLDALSFALERNSGQVNGLSIDIMGTNSTIEGSNSLANLSSFGCLAVDYGGCTTHNTSTWPSEKGYSLCMWVRVGVRSGYWLDKLITLWTVSRGEEEGDGNGLLSLGIRGKTLVYSCEGSEVCVDCPALLDGVWHCVALSHLRRIMHQSLVKLYVDGEVVKDAKVPLTLSIATTGMWVFVGPLPPFSLIEAVRATGHGEVPALRMDLGVMRVSHVPVEERDIMTLSVLGPGFLGPLDGPLVRMANLSVFSYDAMRRLVPTGDGGVVNLCAVIGSAWDSVLEEGIWAYEHERRGVKKLSRVLQKRSRLRLLGKAKKFVPSHHSDITTVENVQADDGAGESDSEEDTPTWAVGNATFPDRKRASAHYLQFGVCSAGVRLKSVASDESLLSNNVGPVPYTYDLMAAFLPRADLPRIGMKDIPGLRVGIGPAVCPWLQHASCCPSRMWGESLQLLSIPLNGFRAVSPVTLGQSTFSVALDDMVWIGAGRAYCLGEVSPSVASDIGTVVRSVGGMGFLLQLVASADSESVLFAALRCVVAVLRSSTAYYFLAEAERDGLYQLLSAILCSKADMVTVRVMRCVTAIICVDVPIPELATCPDDADSARSASVIKIVDGRMVSLSNVAAAIDLLFAPTSLLSVTGLQPMIVELIRSILHESNLMWQYNIFVVVALGVPGTLLTLLREGVIISRLFDSVLSILRPCVSVAPRRVLSSCFTFMGLTLPRNALQIGNEMGVFHDVSDRTAVPEEAVNGIKHVLDVVFVSIRSVMGLEPAGKKGPSSRGADAKSDGVVSPVPDGSSICLDVGNAEASRLRELVDLNLLLAFISPSVPLELVLRALRCIVEVLIYEDDLEATHGPLLKSLCYRLTAAFAACPQVVALLNCLMLRRSTAAFALQAGMLYPWSLDDHETDACKSQSQLYEEEARSVREMRLWRYLVAAGTDSVPVIAQSNSKLWIVHNMVVFRMLLRLCSALSSAAIGEDFRRVVDHSDEVVSVCGALVHETSGQDSVSASYSVNASYSDLAALGDAPRDGRCVSASASGSLIVILLSMMGSLLVKDSSVLELIGSPAGIEMLCATCVPGEWSNDVALVADGMRLVENGRSIVKGLETVADVQLPKLVKADAPFRDGNKVDLQSLGRMDLLACNKLVTVFDPDARFWLFSVVPWEGIPVAPISTESSGEGLDLVVDAFNSFSCHSLACHALWSRHMTMAETLMAYTVICGGGASLMKHLLCHTVAAPGAYVVLLRTRIVACVLALIRYAKHCGALRDGGKRGVFVRHAPDMLYHNIVGVLGVLSEAVAAGWTVGCMELVLSVHDSVTKVHVADTAHASGLLPSYARCMAIFLCKLWIVKKERGDSSGGDKAMYPLAPHGKSSHEVSFSVASAFMRACLSSNFAMSADLMRGIVCPVLHIVTGAEWRKWRSGKGARTRFCERIADFFGLLLMGFSEQLRPLLFLYDVGQDGVDLVGELVAMADRDGNGKLAWNTKPESKLWTVFDHYEECIRESLFHELLDALRNANEVAVESIGGDLLDAWLTDGSDNSCDAHLEWVGEMRHVAEGSLNSVRSQVEVNRYWQRYSARIASAILHSRARTWLMSGLERILAERVLAGLGVMIDAATTDAVTFRPASYDRWKLVVRQNHDGICLQFARNKSFFDSFKDHVRLEALTRLNVNHAPSSFDRIVCGSAAGASPDARQPPALGHRLVRGPESLHASAIGSELGNSMIVEQPFDMSDCSDVDLQASSGEGEVDLSLMLQSSTDDAVKDAAPEFKSVLGGLDADSVSELDRRMLRSDSIVFDDSGPVLVPAIQETPVQSREGASDVRGVRLHLRDWAAQGHGDSKANGEGGDGRGSHGMSGMSDLRGLASYEALLDSIESVPASPRLGRREMPEEAPSPGFLKRVSSATKTKDLACQSGAESKVDNLRAEADDLRLARHLEDGDVCVALVNCHRIRGMETIPSLFVIGTTCMYIVSFMSVMPESNRIRPVGPDGAAAWGVLNN